MPNFKTMSPRNAERGNAVIIGLVVLVIAAVGVLAFLSGKIGTPADPAEPNNAVIAEPASGEEEKAQETASAEDAQNAETPTVPVAPMPEIKKGNPTVAKVNGDEVKRVDVLNYIQAMAPNARQVPIDQLFPMALNQVVNAEIVEGKVSKANLDNDPLVKEQLAVAKDQIIRRVYVQKQIEQAMTEERLQDAYEQFKANYPEIEEVKTRHILVEDEDTAKDVLKKLKDGGDFAALAKEYSIDATKDSGGELGYISKQDQVIPEYLEAAFSLKDAGDLTKKPVKSDFGYHVIELQEKRIRPVPEFNGQTKAFLANQLTAQVMNELMAKWREEADVTVFDINGEEIEPAAGQEAPEAAPAAEEKAE